MSEESLKTHVVEGLLTMLDETFEQVHGIYLDRGTSLFETLEGIPAEVASRPVSARCASLAAQVAHVTFYLEVLSEYAQGRNPGKVDWGEVWRTVHEVTPEEWEASKARLRERYQSVLALIRNAETWDEAMTQGAMAMLVHTGYHLGEIRQALCTLMDNP